MKKIFLFLLLLSALVYGDPLPMATNQGVIFHANFNEGSGVYLMNLKVAATSGTYSTEYGTGGWVDGKWGLGFSFAKCNFNWASDTYWTNNADKLSINVWVYPTAGGADEYDFICGNLAGNAQDNWQFWLYYGTGMDLGMNGNGAQDMTGTYIVPLNKWTMVSLVYNGATCSYYINGKFLETITPALAPLIGVVTRPFYVGNRPSSDTAFQGVMDELTIWYDTISSGKIANMYRKTKAGHID